MAEFWTVNGVSADVQEDLFAGIDAGVWPQADAGEGEPVSVETVEQNGNVETIETYADGSIAVSAVQIEGGEFDASSFAVDDVAELGIVQPMAIKGCTVKAGSGYANYTDCQVIGTTATLAQGFFASYSIVQGINNDKILRHSGPFQQCAGVVCDTPYVGLECLAEVSGRKAQVTYFMRWTGSGGSVASATSTLQLLVGANTASSTFKAKGK